MNIRRCCLCFSGFISCKEVDERGCGAPGPNRTLSRPTTGGETHFMLTFCDEYPYAPLLPQKSICFVQDNLFEWHFSVRGPPDSDFDGGVYHGRIVLPPEYPMKPPSIILLTVRHKINNKLIQKNMAANMHSLIGICRNQGYCRTGKSSINWNKIDELF